MRRKKQISEQHIRRVRPQQKANVFSYYAKRAAADVPQARRKPGQSSGSAQGRSAQPSRHIKLSNVPVLLASLMIFGSLAYISTLSHEPRLQVPGEAKASLTHNIQEYENGISSILRQSVSSRSKLLINTDEVAKKVSSTYPELGEVIILLPIVGRRPVVRVQPAAASFILTNDDEGGGLAVDSSGRVIARAADIDDSAKGSLPFVLDESGYTYELGEYAVTKEAAGFVREVHEQLARKKYRIRTMVLPAITNELHVRIEGRPYYVKFDLKGDSRVQAGTYIAVRSRLSKDGVTPREYVDVRVPGKAYYK